MLEIRLLRKEFGKSYKITGLSFLLFLFTTPTFGSLPTSPTPLSPEKERSFNYPIHSLLASRYSSRAMSGEEIENNELFSLFEAARWAPSCYNTQPWRFLYAKRSTKQWDMFFAPLVEFNQRWCESASALIVLLSMKENDHGPLSSHSLDCGSAMMSLILQGTSKGYVVHPMTGFSSEQLRSSLQIPETYEIEAMIAVGFPAPKTVLPPFIRQEEKITTRNSLDQIVKEGIFPDEWK